MNQSKWLSDNMIRWLIGIVFAAGVAYASLSGLPGVTARVDALEKTTIDMPEMREKIETLDDRADEKDQDVVAIKKDIEYIKKGVDKILEKM